MNSLFDREETVGGQLHPTELPNVRHLLVMSGIIGIATITFPIGFI